MNDLIHVYLSYYSELLYILVPIWICGNSFELIQVGHTEWVKQINIQKTDSK